MKRQETRQVVHELRPIAYNPHFSLSWPRLVEEAATTGILSATGSRILQSLCCLGRGLRL